MALKGRQNSEPQPEELLAPASGSAKFIGLSSWSLSPSSPLLSKHL